MKPTAARESPPYISVITATRNAASTLEQLQASLLTQDCRHFEWIVVDAVSDDATVPMLQGYTAANDWVRFVSEPDFGFYHALNKGLALARGEFYVVAGADDAFDPLALSRYAEAAQAGNPDVVLAQVRKGSRVLGGFHPEKSWIGHPSVFTGSHSIGMLIRRSLHLRHGLYSRRFPLLADGYFLKTLLNDAAVQFKTADFIAGTFAETGMTAVNKLQTLAETWQIQMLTERWSLLQVLLFIGKIAVRYPAVLRELTGRKAPERART